MSSTQEQNPTQEQTPTRLVDPLHVSVTVEELKRAWTAVRSGQFRAGAEATDDSDDSDDTGDIGDIGEPTSPAAGLRWVPGPGEGVLPVIGCAGSCGASTLAVALATAAARPARVVECASLATSGLAAASTAELGRHEAGWIRGTRDGVLLERAGAVLGCVEQVPTPSRPDRPVGLSVLDVGWQIGHVLASTGWLGRQVRGADLVVLVATATVPGLRRLEYALALLAGTDACAAVLGPPQRKWPRPLRYAAGALTESLEQAGRLIVLPPDRALAIAGLDTTELPTPLLDAAAALLRLCPTPQTTTKGSTP